MGEMNRRARLIGRVLLELLLDAVSVLQHGGQPLGA